MLEEHKTEIPFYDYEELTDLYSWVVDCAEDLPEYTNEIIWQWLLMLYYSSERAGDYNPYKVVRDFVVNLEQQALDDHDKHSKEFKIEL